MNRAMVAAARWSVAFVFLLLMAPALRAHPILQNPMWVEVAPDMIRVKLMVSVRELGVIQGVPINPDGTVEMALAEETAPKHSPYVLDHLMFRADGLPLGGKVVSITPPASVGVGAEAPDLAHFEYRLEYPLSATPAVVTLSQSMCVEFPSAPGVPWDLSYAYRFGPPGQTPRQFGALPREVTISYRTDFPGAKTAAPGAAEKGAKNALAAGWEYFATAAGWWLFLAALAVNAVSHRDGARQLGIAAIGFVIGYGLAAARWLTAPGWIFPALGGAGVILVALDNIYRVRQPADGRRLIFAAVFSLVQGLAAAAVLVVPVSAVFVGFAGLGVFCVIALASAGMARTVRPPERLHPVWQLLSLGLAVGGIYFLLDGMGLHPWRR